MAVAWDPDAVSLAHGFSICVDTGVHQPLYHTLLALPAAGDVSSAKVGEGPEQHRGLIHPAGAFGF